jgi:hypothetical protein
MASAEASQSPPPLTPSLFQTPFHPLLSTVHLRPLLLQRRHCVPPEQTRILECSQLKRGFERACLLFFFENWPLPPQAVTRIAQIATPPGRLIRRLILIIM